MAEFSPTGGRISATCLGGSNVDQANAVVVDSPTSVVVTGHTASSDFPGLPNVAREDAFVVRLTSAGTAILYSRSLGGSGNTSGRAIATDGLGNVYVAGSTSAATGFATAGAFQTTLHGPHDAFVAALTSTGATSFVTYLGGSDDVSDSEGNRIGIKVDASGKPVVVGATGSTDFPMKAPLQAAFGGGTSDGFISVLTQNGSALFFSTFLGGSGDDNPLAVGLGGCDGVSNDIYVAGYTSSPNLPGGGIPGGGNDGFVTKVSLYPAKYVYGDQSATCPNNFLATSGTLLAGGSPYTFNGPIDILRVLYGGLDHNGHFDCNGAVRKALISSWASFFSQSCASEATCTASGLTHAWREPDGSPVTADFINLVGFGSRGIPGVNPFCNSRDANTGTASVAGDADYADDDPIRVACDDNDTVCESDSTLGVVLPIVIPDSTIASSTDTYPPVACDPGSCALSDTGDPALLCPRHGPKKLGRCYQPYKLMAGGVRNFDCLATPFSSCFGDQGVDGRAYNLPVKQRQGTEGAFYALDANGNEMTGAFFRIHMQLPSTYAPGTPPTCRWFTPDQQIGCLVCSDPCSLGNAGPAALGIAANQPL
jgi:hypothetical protein